jgi:hypothetical protein
MSTVIVKRFVRDIAGAPSHYSIRCRPDGLFQLWHDDAYAGMDPPYEFEDEPISGIYADVGTAEAELLRMRPDLKPKPLDGVSNEG